MSGFTAPTDDVSILVGDKQVSGWESVRITRGAELVPSHFELTATEQFTNTPTDMPASPGSPCQIFIGTTLVITGWIDTYSAQLTHQQHEVQISGRGLCEDLVDCSVVIDDPAFPTYNGSIWGSSVQDLAQKLALPFKIDVVCPPGDPGPPIEPIVIGLGDTPIELIMRVASYAAFLVYENEKGQLVLDRVGTMQMATGFAQGVNVEFATTTVSFAERFSKLVVVWNSVDSVVDGGAADAANNRYGGPVYDAGMLSANRFRPRVVVSPQTDNTITYGERLAQWEMSRRWGRGQVVQLTCDKWRDENGMLWTPNWLATVDLPAMKLVNKTWIIGQVTFRRDETGTHADLVLMPPEAFSVQPLPLNLYELEFHGGVPPQGGAVQTPSVPPPTGPGGLLGHI